jgi:glutathione reductase (NADPH)
MHMAAQFDLVIVGTGASGSTVAYTCRNAGWKVAVIDSRPFGGTCANRGCDPKKVLVGPSHTTDLYRRMQSKGIFKDDIHIDWPALMHFKRTFTESVPQDREKAYKEAGIITYHQRAHFVNHNTLQVAEEQLQAEHFVIAAGSKKRNLGIPGEELLTSSTEFLDMDELPGNIIMVGGGYISFEFAHIAARAGANITILHNSAHPLKNFDPDLVHSQVKRTEELGVNILLNTRVIGLAKVENQIRLVASQGGKEVFFNCDMAVHAAGRAPEINDLQVENAGIERIARGIVVNEYLQSVSNPSVYAVGDSSASGLPLTPVARMQGSVAATNLLGGNQRKFDGRAIPTTVFTTPTLAAVGLLEEEARSQGLKFKVNYADTSGWYTARRVAETAAAYKVLVEEGSERILGAHLLGPHASEVINIFAVAMRAGMKASELKGTIFTYPTAASDIVYML